MQISVIVPVYKVEPYLRRCVDSILSQTFRDFELILVDDGSPDNCGMICDEYAARDSRVRVIHQANRGVSAARNVGLDAAQGEYYAFVDSDDWVHPQYLELLYDGVKESTTLISGCDMVWVASEEEANCENISCQISVKKPEDLYLKPTGNGIYAYIWRYLYHRSMFEGIRFPEGLLWEDVHTLHKVLFRTDELTHLEAGLYFYFQRNDSITKAVWSEKNFALLSGCREIIAFFENNPNKRIYRCVTRGYFFQIANQYGHLTDSGLGVGEKRRYQCKIKWTWVRAYLRYRKPSELPKRVFVRHIKMMFPKIYNIQHKIYDLRCAIPANLHDRIVKWKKDSKTK